jgi:hypothetical protein
MHTCQVRIGKIPEGAEYSLECGWWYQDEAGSVPWEIHDQTYEQECGAPANKKLGLVWVCDPHYTRNEDIEDDSTNPVIAIFEAGNWDEEEIET